MNSLSERALACKNFDIGYALYCQGLGIEHCHNEAQQRGWRNANRSDAAASFVQALCSTGSSATRADQLLAEVWAN